MKTNQNQVWYLVRFSLLAPAVFALMIASFNQQARASSSGCTSIGDRGFSLTCISVKGKGLSVDKVKGSFTKVTNLCNWRYDIVYTDTNGAVYRTQRGSTHSGCAGVGNFTVNYKPAYKAQTGGVCAQLFVNGKYVNAACQSIFP